MVCISRSLIPNFATKIMGRLGMNDDYQRLGADMGMNSRQLEWARTNLRPGTFVVQVAEGPWRAPFVVRVPQLKIKPNVGDKEVARSTAPLESLPTVPAVEFANWEPHHVIVVRAEGATTVQSSTAGTELPERDCRFLNAVDQNPGKPSSAYAKLAGLGAKRAVDIRKELVERGFLREHEVATGSRGRNAIVLELTEKGRDALAARTKQVGGV